MYNIIILKHGLKQTLNYFLLPLKWNVREEWKGKYTNKKNYIARSTTL
jgi:hypothetical protein